MSTPENSNEVTQRLDAVIAEVRKLEARDKRRAKTVARQPMEWSAALVLIVFALVMLGAWVAFLFVS